MLGLCCCAGFFSGCGEQGLLSSHSVRASHCGGLSCGPRALGHVGFSSCGSRAPEHRLSGCGTQAYLLLALPYWHMVSSQTRDWTCVPWISRWILNPGTTREAPVFFFPLILMYCVSSHLPDMTFQKKPLHKWGKNAKIAMVESGMKQTVQNQHLGGDWIEDQSYQRENTHRSTHKRGKKNS